ncbi:GDYXXLXY domain-containing protein [Halobacillus litoralis]|uniref:GDYXXLXY domain-containing protein n=1 Tax=Halobacillus litoralis TaxID=45668 RepID=UPI001CD5DC1A|nr:GDYXXLXY domain-containing protein [Halobacillus litoralis]MCA0969628.1 GDYXXLXY domain-containing protein [Halobacillus litoralis]
MKKIWIYSLLALQILFLVLMSAGFYAMDSFGETIKLRTAPVDPRDPFYGDYVILNYEVENFASSKWEGGENIERGGKVNLLVERAEDGVYQLVKASDGPLDAQEAQLVLDARMEWHDQYNETYRVDLGMDRYYVEENTGSEWEGMDDRIVTIVLAPWGQKKIASIE